MSSSHCLHEWILYHAGEACLVILLSLSFLLVSLFFRFFLMTWSLVFFGLSIAILLSISKYETHLLVLCCSLFLIKLLQLLAARRFNHSTVRQHRIGARSVFWHLLWPHKCFKNFSIFFQYVSSYCLTNVSFYSSLCSFLNITVCLHHYLS